MLALIKQSKPWINSSQSLLYRKRKRTYNKSTHLWPLSSTIHEFGGWKGKEKRGMTSEREYSPPPSAADLSARKKVSDCLFAGFMWWLTFEWWNFKESCVCFDCTYKISTHFVLLWVWFCVGIFVWFCF